MNYLKDKRIEEAAQILQALGADARAEALNWLRGFAAGQAGAKRGRSATVIAWPGPATPGQGAPGSNRQEG